METLQTFTDRLSKNIGCFYHKCKAETYSLKKIDTNQRGRMGVFAWIQELRRENQFKISTYKRLSDMCHVTNLADDTVLGMHYVSKKKDNGDGTGVVFYVKNNSLGSDYNKTADALRAILQIL